MSTGVAAHRGLTAMRIEALKLLRSPVGIIASAAIVGGIAALITVIMAAVASGNTDLTAKMGNSASLDWSGLVDSAAQVTSAGGLLGFGVVLAWVFAREFTDGTITGLFGLPVGRGWIAAAKLITYLVWAICVSLALAVALLIVGLAFGFGAPDAAAWDAIARQFALGILCAALAVPVAWVTSLARSLLAGVSTAIGLVIVAQIGVLAGAGGWMPFAAPALWAIPNVATVSPLQLAMPVLLAAVAGAATVVSWLRLQLDR